LQLQLQQQVSGKGKGGRLVKGPRNFGITPYAPQNCFQCN